MPLREYECRQCGHRCEVLVRAGMVPACGACASEDLTQLLSSFAVSSPTRRRALVTSARQKAESLREEKRHAEHQYMHQHVDDHR